MPIPILQYGVKVRDPTTQQFSDLAALRGGQGPQGTTGPGVPAGGTDGDVLVKNGAEDYAARWTNTPPQMGSLAYIEQTSTVSKQGGYQPGDYLVYNGQLYKATETISPDETLNPGQGGNIDAVSVCDGLTTISANLSVIGNTYTADWIATESTAGNTPLTNTIANVPAGSYLVIAKVPNMGGATSFLTTLQINGSGIDTLAFNANYQTQAYFVNRASAFSCRLVSAQSGTFNFSVLDRGSLTLLRIN